MALGTNTMNGSSTLTPIPDSLATYGALMLLAAHCPRHKTYPADLLNRLFLPPVEHKSIRLFQTSSGQPCAALIWARLSEDVALRMFTENRPPKAHEWNSGHHLWFLDLLAPFGHGMEVARHLARNPPREAFSFARIGPDNKLRKLVEVQSGGQTGRRNFDAYFAGPNGTI